MTAEEQLRAITEGRIWQVVQEHLGGDWARRNELFTIPQSRFDAWADSIDLPHGRVHGEPQPCDGVYVIQERGRYVVFVQERGARVFDCGEFSDFLLAKRKALATEYLYGITLRAG
jgi:hypothetical protein